MYLLMIEELDLIFNHLINRQKYEYFFLKLYDQDSDDVNDSDIVSDDDSDNDTPYNPVTA